VNVENWNDNECFRWSVIAALHPVMEHSARLGNYKQYANKINWTGISFPTPLHQIRTFELDNPSVSVNVYICKPEESHAIIPTYLTKHTARTNHIDLLLLTEKDKTHYTWIRNMSSLFAHTSACTSASFVCPHCVHKFTTEEAFTRHFPDCSKRVCQQVVFSDSGKETLEWKSRNKCELNRYIIYFDFEACLSTVDPVDPSASKTEVIDTHIPSAFCAYTVSQDREYPNSIVTFSGPDVMEIFFEYLMSEQIRIVCIEGKNIEMLPLTQHQQEKFDKAEYCKHCKTKFSDQCRKVCHHNHATGAFIAALCNSCNL